MAGRRSEPLHGERFGKLTAKTIDHIGPAGHTYWLCECDCGNYTIVRASHLKSGNVASCGCAGGRRTHGKSKSRLYRIWNNMKQRCFNPNSAEYHLYGLRGVSVCKEWLDSFEHFHEWAVANGYQDDLSIDRIDNNGPYAPWNCRWATAREQANNTRKTRFITYNGETRSMAEWSRTLGIKQSTLNMRINKYRWSVEEALGKGVRQHGS